MAIACTSDLSNGVYPYNLDYVYFSEHIGTYLEIIGAMKLSVCIRYDHHNQNHIPQLPSDLKSALVYNVKAPGPNINSFSSIPAKIASYPFAQTESLLPNGKTYDPPTNPNDKSTIIYNDSDDEAKKAGDSSSSKPKKPDQPPLKAYKPKNLKDIFHTHL
ncbi:hypothetical protein Tco_1050825 [Tanacetum coccineum]